MISINTGIPASASGLSITVRATDTGGLTTNASAGGAGDLAIPLCQAQGDVIDVPYSATCSGTKYNYYDRCYGGQGSQDPGDKYQEYFCPDDLTYSNVDGHCNSDFEDILSNNVSVDTTTSGAALTNFLNNERFTKIFVGGKALVNGAVTSATINIDGHSSGFNVEEDMIVTGTGIPANTTVQTVTSCLLYTSDAADE